MSFPDRVLNSRIPPHIAGAVSILVTVYAFSKLGADDGLWVGWMLMMLFAGFHAVQYYKWLRRGQPTGTKLE